MSLEGNTPFPPFYLCSALLLQENLRVVSIQLV